MKGEEKARREVDFGYGASGARSSPNLRKDKKRKRRVGGDDCAALRSEEVQKKGNGIGGKGRNWTVSIAIPGSVVDNAQSKELKTLLVGQIARAAAIFEIDEVVVYDDGMGKKRNSKERDGSSNNNSFKSSWDPNVFMARVLQYMETPQYLRKKLLPMHPDLRFAGLLAPLDSPHHVRSDETIPYREGVVVEHSGHDTTNLGMSFACVGFRKDIRLNMKLSPGIRVTVEFDEDNARPSKKNHIGKAVAPCTPRQEAGLYWGYETRIAGSLGEVFSGCPFPEGYDLTIGTSERGTVSVNDEDFVIKPFRRLLVVFGGVQGIEASFECDESLEVSGEDAFKMFDMWVNVCPGQGSRTIRTEEAVFIAMARLSPYVLQSGGVMEVAALS